MPDETTTPEPPGLDEFYVAYVEAALWSTNDESTPEGGEPFDANFDESDLADDTRTKMREDCAAFMAANAADIEAGPSVIKGQSTPLSQAGHDFWLTREGHGCGFWDGDWPEPASERLTAASEAFGTFDLELGDDGCIHGR